MLLLFLIVAYFLGAVVKNHTYPGGAMKFIARTNGKDGRPYDQEIELVPHETEIYVDGGILSNLIAEHASRNPNYGALRNFREVRPREPNISVILARDGEQTFARVSAHVETGKDLPATPKDLKLRLYVALREWFVNTEEGGELWLESHQNFNIGDLSEVLDNADLKAFLHRHGINDLMVEVMGSHNPLDSGDWSYDEVLGDPDA